MDVELIIQPDGSLLISRGDSAHNELMCQILKGHTDIEALQAFFSISEESELLFGQPNLCG